MSARVDHGVVSGTFSLDGETFDVDNNVWVVGDDAECVVIDAPHDVDAILALVGDRRLKAILCTHAHDDHVRVAPELRRRVQAPIFLHPADRPLWELTHTDELWDVDLSDGDVIEVAGTTLRVLHTPGHAPGGGLLLRRGPRLRLQRRHPVLRRTRRDRPVVQRQGAARLLHRDHAARRCRPRPWCTPGTGRTPPSARSARTCSVGDSCAELTAQPVSPLGQPGRCQQ